jgi:hypothetical protein
MNEKKRTGSNNKQQPVHAIHSGDNSVTAEVFLYQSPTGYRYHGFVLSRRWNSLGTNKETQGNVFFENSESSLIEVVQKVAEWLRTKAHAEPTSEETTTPPLLAR